MQNISVKKTRSFGQSLEYNDKSFAVSMTAQAKL